MRAGPGRPMLCRALRSVRGVWPMAAARRCTEVSGPACSTAHAMDWGPGDEMAPRRARPTLRALARERASSTSALTSVARSSETTRPSTPRPPRSKYSSARSGSMQVTMARSENRDLREEMRARAVGRSGWSASMRHASTSRLWMASSSAVQLGPTRTSCAPESALESRASTRASGCRIARTATVHRRWEEEAKMSEVGAALQPFSAERPASRPCRSRASRRRRT